MSFNQCRIQSAQMLALQILMTQEGFVDLGLLTSGLEVFTKKIIFQGVAMFYRLQVLKVWLLLPRGELL
jgi:hypothetical protein